MSGSVVSWWRGQPERNAETGGAAQPVGDDVIVFGGRIEVLDPVGDFVEQEQGGLRDRARAGEPPVGERAGGVQQ
ncbi:MAG TPA: hypothetical protein VGR06_22915 [Actinophytocola sp.]|uniref:hypothetical protein n=1 Tax=Actinophytocola sp. TaxID=1872138 RepID=UPI002DF978C1|nr:hypothetical protein [Actinophytocola sp.]